MKQRLVLTIVFALFCSRASLAVNMMDYYQPSDGDDYALTLERAISSVTAGTIIEVPNGGWWSTRTVIDINKKVTIMGQGLDNATLFRKIEGNAQIFRITADDVILRNISCTLNDTLYDGTSTDYAIESLGARTAFEQVYMHRIRNGIKLTRGGAWLTNCRFFNTKPDMEIICIWSSESYFNIHGLVIHNAAGQDAKHGILIKDGDYVNIVNSDLMKAGNCIHVEPDHGRKVEQLTIFNTFCDTSSGYGLYLHGTGNGILGAQFINSWATSCNNGIAIFGNTDWVHIEGSEIMDNYWHGIDMGGASVNHVTIKGNNVTSNTHGCGIHVHGNSTNFEITGNYIGQGAGMDKNGWGLIINSGSHDYTVKANIIRNNQYGNYSDNGYNRTIWGNLE